MIQNLHLILFEQNINNLIKHLNQYNYNEFKVKNIINYLRYKYNDKNCYEILKYCWQVKNDITADYYDSHSIIVSHVGYILIFIHHNKVGRDNKQNQVDFRFRNNSVTFRFDSDYIDCTTELTVDDYIINDVII